jgi:glutathione peroxidase
MESAMTRNALLLNLAAVAAAALLGVMPVAMATTEAVPSLAAPPRGASAFSFERFAITSAAEDACPMLLRHSFTPIQGGAPQSLCQYQGKVVLVVNTASQCGYTPQYEGLEALHRKFKERGLVVIGFPSNDFGGQEPGTNKEIAEFCRTVYGVQFPMYEKQAVGKLAANPLYGELIARTGQAPKWNFHKYVIDRSGARVTSFKSDTEPDSRALVGLIERLLGERPPAVRG